MSEEEVRNDLREMRYLSKIRLPEAREAFERCKARYADAFAILSERERTVVFRSMIGGVPYRRLGREIGYSEVHIKRIAGAAVRKIAKSKT